MRRRVYFILLIFSVFPACGEESSTSSTVSTTTLQRMYSIVDGLSVHTEPTTNSEVIYRLDLFEEVEYLGTGSDNKQYSEDGSTQVGYLFYDYRSGGEDNSEIIGSRYDLETEIASKEVWNYLVGLDPVNIEYNFFMDPIAIAYTSVDYAKYLGDKDYWNFSVRYWTSHSDHDHFTFKP